MLRNIIFIKALADHFDEIETLLGDDWILFRKKLSQLLDALANEQDSEKISARVNMIYRALCDTSAKNLVSKLFQQAVDKEKLDRPGTRETRHAYPTIEIMHLEGLGIPRGTVNSNSHDANNIRNLAKDINSKIVEQREGVGPEPDVRPATDKAQSVSTFPNLLGDDYSYLNQPYRIKIKLSDQAQPGGAHISAPGIEIPVKAGEIVKKIQVSLSAADFDLDPSESARGWTRDIDFYPSAAASSCVEFTLCPQDRFEQRYFSLLSVQFTSGGQVLGHAIRRIEVLKDNAIIGTPLKDFPPVPGYPLDERGEKIVEPVATPVVFRPDEPDVHLTVTISETENREKFQWQIVSPFLENNDFSAGEYLSSNLGVQEFVREYLAPFGMPGNWPEDHMDNDGCLKDASVNILLSHLLTLRHSVPKQFWTLYKLALDRFKEQGGNPQDFSILFITADTHIPWELMPLSDNFDDEPVSLLGTDHQVGRWLLGTGKPIPDSKLDLHGLSLLAPIYEHATLQQAQLEKDFISDHYHPYVLPDEPEEFLNFMKTGEPTGGTGILHFAGHGDCCTDKLRRNWLVLSNGQSFYDINSAGLDRGNKLGKLHPVLAFFNACNVGRAAAGPLGSNGGWGRALLNQQYKGYIGPLWSVYDLHARDICEMFYTMALDESLSLGEVMRRIRHRFTENNQLFTYLAYLYLGHPLAKITYTPFKE